MSGILLRSVIAAFVFGALGLGCGILYGCVLATGEYVTDDHFFGQPPEVVFMALLVVPPIVLGAAGGVSYFVCALVRRMIAGCRRHVPT